MELTKLDQAYALIVEAKTVDETKQIIGQAERLKHYAKERNLSFEIQFEISVIKLRAERKAGQLLKEVELNKGAATRSHDGTTQKLSDFDINKNQSSRWQSMADIPDDLFEETILEYEKQKEEITQKAILNIAKDLKRDHRNKELRQNDPETPNKKYQIIYADPPWSYGKDYGENYSHVSRHYPTMKTETIAEIDIVQYFDENAVLFLWATSPLLEDAFVVINGWGFNYKTSFIWDKVKHNFGYYNSVRHELLLIATRGSFLPENKTLYDSVQVIERTNKHSEKPKEFRNIIDDLYPNGNKIEIFAREIIEGWDHYGNEAV